MTARLSLDAPLASAGSWPARRPPSVAMNALRHALKAEASQTISEVIEMRARDFAICPCELDALETNPTRPPLSALAPHQLRWRIAALIGEEIITISAGRRPSIGIGGETIILNLKAAAVYAERLCAIASRNAREAAP
jgi:hypothetical protein